MSDQYFINRQNKLRELLAKNNLDGMLVTNLIHIRYLCGFTGSAGSLVLTNNSCDFITDGRYTFQSKNEVKGAKTTISSNPHLNVVKKNNLLVSGAKIGFDSKNISHQTYLKLQKSLSNITWNGISGYVESLSMVKDDKEIQAIKTAVEITDKAFAEVFPMIQIGVQEKDIANALSVISTAVFIA
jgi:Xaa-Pro aminopeptidase